MTSNARVREHLKHPFFLHESTIWSSRCLDCCNPRIMTVALLDVWEVARSNVLKISATALAIGTVAPSSKIYPSAMTHTCGSRMGHKVRARML